MTRNRLHLRTAPRAAEGAHPRRLGRDLFDSKAFAGRRATRSSSAT